MAIAHAMDSSRGITIQSGSATAIANYKGLHLALATPNFDATLQWIGKTLER